MRLLNVIAQTTRRSSTYRAAQEAVVGLLRAALPHYIWVGIYMVEGRDLVLEGWDGPAATDHTRIPINTKAEIVVPIVWGSRVIGEIDVDGDRIGAFNGADQALLEAVAAVLAERWAREQAAPALQPDTRAAMGSGSPERGIRPLTVPIYQSATYEFENMAALEAFKEHEDQGYIYTRWANPTIRAAEEVIAGLEEAEDAVLFASGMGAIATTLLALLSAGDEVVAPYALYSGTYHLLDKVLPRYGITARFVRLEEMSRLDEVVSPRTKVVYFEPVTNPMVRVVDVPAVVAACRDRGIRVVVDNTLETPLNLQPLKMGVDLVIHSATKYLSGHGDLVSGVVSGSEALLTPIRHHLRYLGANFNPPEAAMLSRGLKTFPMRVRRQNETALKIAQWLSGRPEAATVSYPGLPGHPEYAVATRLLPRGAGGLVAFDVKGGLPAAKRVVDRLTLWHRTVSLGDVESLAAIPVLTSHWNVSPQGLEHAGGITGGTIRLAVGVEDCGDLTADLAQALDASDGAGESVAGRLKRFGAGEVFGRPIQ